MITLRSSGAELDLKPEIGGAVSQFSIDGVDILRRAPAGAGDVLQMGCFPLLPFANRIADGRFTFAGETVRLPRNFGDHPHALHGQGWQSVWRIAAQSCDAATLAFEHPAGAWPWEYAAQQTFVLSPQTLAITLQITNLSARAMPVSLGFHPYFSRWPDTRLQAAVAGVWLSDETCVPTVQAGPSHFLDLSRGALLAAAPFVDHCHFGWKGRALVDRDIENGALVMTASPELDFLHCYVPQGADFFCAEPVSAMPDAFNRAPDKSGMRILAPRETFAASMALSLQTRD